MIDARLQYGPFDGATGHVREPVPLALDVIACRDCGCGHHVHYHPGNLDEVPPCGYARYEFIGIDDAGAVYRHADTLDLVVERTLAKAVHA